MKLNAVRAAVVFGYLGVTGASMALAQRPAPAVVQVHVTDASLAPLRDVDLVVVKNGADIVLLGQTSAGGRYTFRFDPDSGRYRLVVRKLGYVQTTRLLAVAPRETLTVELSLARLPPSLDTIRAEAQMFPLARQPYLSAEEIDRDTRGVFTLLDVLLKERWDINYQGARCVTKPGVGGKPQAVRLGRGGAPVGPVHSIDPVQPSEPRVYVNGKWIPNDNGFDPFRTINAEHILEMRLVTCLDASIPGLPPKSWPSIYIALKPGAAWSVKLGTYVADSAVYQAAERERLGGKEPPR